jgi:sarcosine oxidase subunit alpha
VNGRPVRAYAGESLLAVLAAEGVVALRRGREAGGPAAARGALCGMGVCQECRVAVDGVADRRACLTVVAEGMEVVVDGD